MRHRILRIGKPCLPVAQRLMERTHWTGVVDYPIDELYRGSQFLSAAFVSDMRDEVERFRKESRYSVKPVTHTKTHLRLKNDAVVVSTGASGSYTYVYTIEGNLPGIYTDLHPTIPAPDGDLDTYVSSLPSVGNGPQPARIDWETLEAEFMEASKSLLSTEVLLGETIAQPQLVVDAVKFLISPATGINSFVKYVAKHYGKQMRRHRTGYVARRVLKDAANSTLMFNFGIRPMISDLEGLIKAPEVVGQRIDYLKRNKGRFVPVRVRQSSTDASAEYTSDYHPTYATIYTSPSELHIKAVMGAWYRVRNDTTLESNFKAYSQYFGLGRVVGLLWELVPFSFVVDWVSNAQERLNKFSQVHFANPYCETRGFCASIKETVKTPIRLSSGYFPVRGTTIADALSGIELGSIETTRYSRFFDLPESRHLFDLSDVGLPQIINGGSLLIQKLLKNR